jgi:hypothetical protein
MKRRPPAFVLFSVLILTIAACLPTGCTAPGEQASSAVAIDTSVAASATPRPSATIRPTPRSAPADTPVLPLPTATDEAVPVYTPDLAWLASESRDGWQTYENAAYGFYLRYPRGWTLTEVTGSVDGADSRNVLRIAFRGLYEDRQIMPTGMSQGEIVPRGNILFLGQTLTRQALVDGDADNKILYELGQVERGDMVFWMVLDRVAEGDAERSLSEETQRTADAILSSVVAPAP